MPKDAAQPRPLSREVFPRHFRALERLRKAVELLATHEGEIAVRLLLAYEKHLRDIRPSDLDLAMMTTARDSFVDLTAALSRHDVTQNLTPEEASSLAHRIFLLYDMTTHAIAASLP